MPAGFSKILHGHLIAGCLQQINELLNMNAMAVSFEAAIAINPNMQP